MELLTVDLQKGVVFYRVSQSVPEQTVINRLLPMLAEEAFLDPW